MIVAYAYLRCDHPGCEAAILLTDQLKFGQLNPIQVRELWDLGRGAGWIGYWAKEHIEHACPKHAHAAMEPPPPPENMAAALAERMKDDGL